MADLYIDQKPDPEQRITELHVWVAIYGDGSEGIISADATIAGQLRHMPLMSSKLGTAHVLRPLAQRSAAMGAESDHEIRIELRTFKAIRAP